MNPDLDFLNVIRRAALAVAEHVGDEELRDFIADDEQSPRTMLDSRHSSLDPQLVWRGKDEQDRQYLAVPVVPIYILSVLVFGEPEVEVK